MKTVGELKKFLENMPDDAPLVIYKSDIERSGYVQEVYPALKLMSVEKAEAVDGFDYTVYEYERYVPNKNGTPTLTF